jgi:hypothetical protein
MTIEMPHQDNPFKDSQEMAAAWELGYYNAKKLFKVWQDANNDYDTYSDAVICADNLERAKEISCTVFTYGWTDISNVEAKEIGTAIKGLEEGVITASFHAG